MSIDIKYCGKCCKELLVSLFTINRSQKDGLQRYCRECMKVIRRNHYTANKSAHKFRNDKSKSECKEYILNLKNTTPCVDCGVIFFGEPWLTEFDHLDAKDKYKPVSQLITFGIGKLKREIAKCDLVCTVCHRRRTANRAGWRSNVLDHLLFK